jgi:hypothetical protein
MQRVVVTIKREDEARVRDIEVPADVEVERLSDLIARALHWDSGPGAEPLRYEIEAHPLGRMLKPYESLVSAGVWDGAWLVMYPIKAAAPTVETVPPSFQIVAPTEPQPELPVATQTPIEAEPTPTSEHAIPVQQPQPAFVVEPVDQASMPAFIEVTQPQQVVQPSQPPPVEEATQYAQDGLRIPTADDYISEDNTKLEIGVPSGPPKSEEPYDLEALLAETAPPNTASTQVTQTNPPFTAPTVTPEPYPAATASEVLPNTDTRPSSEFVSGWRGLGISLPLQSSEEEAEEEEKPSGGFVWKQLSD